MNSSLSWSKKLFALLLGLWALRLVPALTLPLSPQETYYWVYSLHPALSYFDHPPLTAYTILFFTRIFGHTALAVRLGALCYAFGSSWLVFLIGKRLFNERVGFWSAVLLNFLPTFSLTALIMTPDCPLLFFWCLTLYGVLQALEQDRYGFYLGAGLSLGLALLSKYSAVLLPLSFLIYLLLSPAHRRHLKRPEPYLGILLALLIFSPVMIWNARHDWASFAFQSTGRAGMIEGLHWDEFLGFLGSQMGILTPLVFIGLAVTAVKGCKRAWRQNRWPETFLLSGSLPMIVFFTLVALMEWVKINWLIPAYPGLLILMTAYYQQGLLIRKGVKTITALLQVTVILFFVLLHLTPFLPQIPLSGSADTLTGWRELAGHLEGLQTSRAGLHKPFVFAWGHKTASELQFYLKGQPETYAQNVLGKKALAYDYWFQPLHLKGRDALFVWSELDPFPDEGSGLLEQFFERVQPLEPFTVYRGKAPLRTFRIYLCFSYKGGPKGG